MADPPIQCQFQPLPACYPALQMLENYGLQFLRFLVATVIYMIRFCQASLGDLEVERSPLARQPTLRPTESCGGDH